MNTRQGFQESSFQDSSGSYLRRLRRLSFFTKAIHATKALMKHRKIISSQQVAEKKWVLSESKTIAYNICNKTIQFK